MNAKHKNADGHLLMQVIAPRATPGGGRWVRHVDLLLDTPLHCIDGRCQRRIVGTPGGNLGELVAVLSAFERAAKPLSDAKVEAALRAAVRAFGAFYVHTDAAALARLGGALGLAGSSLDSLIALLHSPPEELRESLLDVIAAPEHIGCGHLAGMARRPELYEVRPGLLRATLRAFYRLLWTGAPELQLEVLEGSHAEVELIVVRSCEGSGFWGRCPTIAPNSPDALPRFVYHIDAAAWARRRLAHLLAAVIGPGFSARDVLADRADENAAVQAEVTRRLLATGCPVRELHPCSDPTVNDAR